MRPTGGRPAATAGYENGLTCSSRAYSEQDPLADRVLAFHAIDLVDSGFDLLKNKDRFGKATELLTSRCRVTEPDDRRCNDLFDVLGLLDEPLSAPSAKQLHSALLTMTGRGRI
ncbi:hypothetical protein AGR2A_Cc140099 [Agrobacterium genomosp. 2 str. CFBP 5494]|uniref:Uncharacterized protein n=1 Tax=Agrobacterium genomosp. 2 str. CFBP 5494 TaxID=1183436 RepID=A0A9W5AZ36_9HYPH|nr:hypothetical protein AGR2A_Cc140099 [Agrobacterium genomosp. 2 str. CFBP 5494]